MNVQSYYNLMMAIRASGYPDPFDRTEARLFAQSYCFAWNEI